MVGRTCQNIADSCPLSGRFSGGYSIHEKGREEEGGPLRVNVSVAGSESGRSIGQALTAQFHRRTPKESLRFFGNRCHCAPNFPRLPFIGGSPFIGKNRMYNGQREKSVERFLLNFNRSVLGSFFTRIG